MATLYKRLFTYRARESLQPKENFLTEAFVDLLARMPLDVIKIVSQEILLPKTDEAKEVWQQHISRASKYTWKSQVAFNFKGKVGIADIVLQDESGNPLIIIENKVGSNLQFYENSDFDIDNQETPQPLEALPSAQLQSVAKHQLELYASWVGARCKDSGWPGAV